MIPNRLLKDGQGSLADFVLLERTELGFVELRLGDVDVLTAALYQQQRTRQRNGEGRTSWWTTRGRGSRARCCSQ